jgi:heat shock protein HslJ
MTDEQMDARLRAAGKRWRTANTAVAEPSEPSEVELAPPAPNRRRNWWAIASAAVVVAALALGGILFARSHDNGNSASKNIALTGVTWTDPDSNGAVVFLDGAARLTGFCGTTTLPLRVDGDHLTIGTKSLGIGAGCTLPGIKRTPAQQRQYNQQQRALARFLRIVHGPATWSIAGDHLTLTKPGVGVITLVTNGAPAPQLVGTQWRLTRYYYDGATTSDHRVSGQAADLDIDADGSFVASDDCGLITGTAYVGRDRVRFVSKSTCIDPGFAPSTALVDAVLSGPVTYTINGDQLFLQTQGAMLTYRAVPTPLTDPAGQLIGSWRLETITQGSGLSSVIGLTTLTVDRRGGLYVERGCPGFNARIGVTAQQLTISNVAGAAGPACPSNYTTVQRRQDGTVDSVLMHDGTVDWAAVSDQLAITRDGTQLTFIKASTSLAVPLVGSWQLDTLGYGGGGSGGGSTATTNTTLTFGRTGIVVVNHRCSEIRGRAKSSGDTMTLSGLKRIVRYCAYDPDAAAHHREDQTVDSVLTGTVTWSLSGDQLTIKNHNNNLTFTKTGGGTPIPAIEILTGRTWSLYEIDGSPANDTPGFTFSDNRISTFCGSTAPMTLLPAQITDIGTWDVTHDPNCQEFASDEQRVVFGKILTGSVNWRIEADTLTITKPGVGQLTFVKTK